jgi:sugar phosphate isomerase/epimerase
MTAELMATCWTSAGDVRPLDDPEISPWPVEARVSAVAAGGWAGIGLAQGDLEVVAATIGFDVLGRQIRDAGLRYAEVELLADWWREPECWRPRWDLLTSAAHALGAQTIKIGTAFGVAVIDHRPFVEPARALAREAEDLGLRLALEPLPFALVASVPQGARLAQDVDHPSFGLCIDAWHVFRAGTSLDELARCLSAELVVSVELDDADPEPVGTLFEDTRDRRRYPGEGSFDLRGLVDVLRTIGFDGPWGVEMLSDEHRGLALPEGLRRARDGALQVLAAGPAAP